MSNTRPNTGQITHTPAAGVPVGLENFLNSLNTGGAKIAVIGDSLLTTNVLLGQSPTEVLESKLNSMGFACSVGNFGRDAHTFFRANTVEFINGLTSVEACVAAQPSIVIVALGLNDTLNAVDGRSVAQVQADATTLFETLRAGLPSAHIIYMGEQAYDATNFIPGSVLNKGIIPALMTLPAIGIGAGKYGSEMLNDAVSTTTRNRVADWVTLNTHCTTRPQVNEFGTINFFRIGRLGGIGSDGLHLASGGNILAAGYIMLRLQTSTLPSLATFFSNNYDVWESPDALFDNALVSFGNGYVNGAGGQARAQDYAAYGSRRLGTWYQPVDVKVSYPALISTTASYVFMVADAIPGSDVSFSLNGAAFVSIGTVRADGTFLSSASTQSLVTGTALTLGTNTIRYAVANVILGPFTVEVVEGTASALPLAISYPAEVTTQASYVVTIENAAPSALVEFSRGANPFVSIGSISANGTFLSSAATSALVSGGTLTIGTNSIRYRVGGVIYGPFTVNVVDAGSGIPPIVWYGPFIENSWVRFNAFTSPIGYGIGPNKRVYLRGVCKSGASGTTVFTLPVGARPEYELFFPSIGASLIANVVIFQDGRVVLTGNNAGITLDGITFQAL